MRSRSGPLKRGHVAIDGDGRTFAGVPTVAQVAAGAGVHRGDEDEAGRERRRGHGARDRHLAGFERLAEDFQAAAMELRQLVQEEDAVVGEADLPGCRRIAASHHAGIGNRVMGIAEGPRRQQGLIRLEPAKGTVDTRRLQALGGTERRHDRRQPSGQHRLAGARAPDHQDIMSASCRNNQGTLGELLAAHVAEIDVVVIELLEQRLHLGSHRFGVQLS